MRDVGSRPRCGRRRTAAWSRGARGIARGGRARRPGEPAAQGLGGFRRGCSGILGRGAGGRGRDAHAGHRGGRGRRRPTRSTLEPNPARTGRVHPRRPLASRGRAPPSPIRPERATARARRQAHPRRVQGHVEVPRGARDVDSHRVRALARARALQERRARRRGRRILPRRSTIRHPLQIQIRRGQGTDVGRAARVTRRAGAQRAVRVGRRDTCTQTRRMDAKRPSLGTNRARDSGRRAQTRVDEGSRAGRRRPRSRRGRRPRGRADHPRGRTIPGVSWWGCRLWGRWETRGGSRGRGERRR